MAQLVGMHLEDLRNQAERRRRATAARPAPGPERALRSRLLSWWSGAGSSARQDPAAAR